MAGLMCCGVAAVVVGASPATATPSTSVIGPTDDADPAGLVIIRVADLDGPDEGSDSTR